MPGGFEVTIWTLLLIASVTDLLWGKIFNATTFPFLLAGLVCRFFWLGAPSLREGALAVFFAFALFFPLWLLKVLAAGDVKLLMAAAAWTDARTVIEVGLISILMGALVGLVVLVRRKKKFNELLKVGAEGGHRMPFAPAFLCAYALVQVARMKGWNLPWVPWMAGV